MTQLELKTAASILGDRIERSEFMALDYSDGYCLSVQWVGGGQRIFYALDDVELNQWDWESNQKGEPVTVDNNP